MDFKCLFVKQDENIYNSFPDAIIVLDFLKNITIVNKRAELLLGYSSSELKNKNVKMIFGEEFDKFTKIIGLSHGTILRATTSTGEVIFVDVTAYDAHNSAKIIISMRAVSDKYLALESLLDDYKQTKELLNNRDSFLSEMKLDFMTPLNAITGFSQSLLEKVCGDINEKQEKYISIINSNSKKLSYLMEKTFDIIYLDANKREFNFKNFDIINILNFVQGNFEKIAQDKNLEYSFSYGDIDKRNVFSDEYSVVQILSILVENALKFTNSGKVKVEATFPQPEFLENNGIKVPTGYNERSYIFVKVSDTGVGIEEELLSSIFDEYSYKNLTRAKKNEGSALSLSIARKLTDKLGGVIWCEKGKDGFTTEFNLILPIERMSFEQ